MAQAEDKNLPSLDDYIVEEDLPSVEETVDSNLPSIEESEESVLPSIEEEVEAELPSVEEFVEQEEQEEELVEEVVVEEDLTLDEVKELIEEVKAEILDIPQIKHFDEVLEKLCEAVDQVKSEIPEVPEPKVYDDEIEAICDAIDSVKENISSLPEVKYYDEQVQNIEDRIDSVIQEVANLPEPKYYDTDLDSIKEDITKVREELAPLPWVENTFSGIEENFEKVSDVIDTLKEKLNFNFDEYSDSIDVKFFESKVETQGIKEEFDSEKEKIWDELKKSSVKIFEYQKTFKDDDRKLKKQILGEYNKLKNNIKKELEEATDKSIKTDELLLGYFTELKEEISNLPEVKYYDEEIDELQKLVSKFNKRFSPVEGDIKSLYRIVEDIKKTQIELNEQILDEPADVSQDVGGGKDPLTPTDQKFATLDDLSKHYTLFVNRIQQQLSTVGGGGAGFIKDLADVDISGLEDGYILQYNASENKWKTVENSGGGGGGSVGTAGTWAVTSTGIHTTKNVGVGTIASATTALIVEGDARITGILTIGSASVTIDGDNNRISTGIVTITNSSVIIGDNVSIDTGASGINSAPNVLYVAKDGDDDNNGTSIDNAFLTIKAAVGAAQSGTTVKVLSGNYVEDNPIELPAFSAVVGDDLRTCKILPNNATSDIFHVNKGCKLQNMTFSGHLSPAAAVAFPDSGATNVGGGKWKGPYVQNCTSDTTTGTGIRIDGSKAVKTKSMNVDAFTQYNQGGVGVAVTNEGYAQLVSVFTICCDKAITCHAGGQADIANSNCSFGTLGLVADGKGGVQYIGTCTASADAAQDNVTINVGAATTRPYDGQIVFFGELFESVETITVGSGGTGYTSTPTVTVDAPTGSSGETATAFATLEGESVASITIISSGSQYQTTPSVTISAPDVGVNTATATATMAPIYYTINSSTPIVSGITTLTLEENLINAVGVGTSVHFFQQSKIVASSHTFEYIGAGNTITEATPKRGGVTIQANEVTKTNGGNVVYTSTDQSGNFRIGDDLQINQNTGTISGRAFSRSLFTEMTPFILALS